MHMIVCDVEGCDAVEKDNQRMLGNRLPSGWKTVQMMVPPSEEEIAAIERQQEEIKAALSTEEIDTSYMMPMAADHMCTFIMCDKHDLPEMKAAAKTDHEFLGCVPALRRRPKAH